jgi:isochorismate hydrolase
MKKQKVYIIYIVDKLTKREFVDKVYGDELMAQEEMDAIKDELVNEDYDVQLEEYDVIFPVEV